MKYIKKPIPVEAIQWTGVNFDQISNFMAETKHAAPVITMNDELIISTLEGEMRAPIDSWIIRGAANEYYPCRGDIFEKTYESVEE